MAKLKGKAKAAFLRRMAKGRNKKHHTTTRKRKHKTGGHVAKRRTSKSKGRKSTRRRHHAGGLGKWLPPTHTLIGVGTAFAYGKVEKAASGDTTHFLNKVPNMVPQIGRTGNIGALAWLVGVVTRHPIVKSVASGVLHVAAYQNGRGAGFTKDSPDFKMSGPGHRPGRGRDEILVENYLNRMRRGNSAG